MAWHHRLVGHAARLYARVRRPRTLGIRALLVDPDGRIALVRHTYVDGWYMPGGGVDKWESAEAALHRELREEAGVTDVRIERILGVYHNLKEGKDDHVVVYVVRADAAHVAALRNADPLEIAEAGWFSPDALPPGMTEATARRIAEYRGEATGAGHW